MGHSASKTESQFIPLAHTVLELAPPALNQDENVSADVTHRLSCYQLKNPPPKQLRSNTAEWELQAHSVLTFNNETAGIWSNNS